MTVFLHHHLGLGRAALTRWPPKTKGPRGLISRPVLMSRPYDATASGSSSSSKSPDNHAQTARNLRRTLRNAAAGARLIQADGLDSKSAAEVSASLADTLEELHRLERRLDRRIRRGVSRASTLPHITTSEASRALLMPGTRPSSRRRDQDVLVQVFFYEVNEF